MKILAAVVGGIVLMAGLVLLVIYSGLYNVAATSEEPGVMRWALHTTMERSVEQHADGIPVPPLEDPELLQTGFEHFDAMCVTCHGAPGIEASEIGKGINPPAPELSDQAEAWSPEELFWITKHGIKMSAMPAFGPTHSDRDLWGIVAFTRRLPQLSPAEYQALREQMEAEGGSTHTHADGSEHVH